MGGRFCEVEQMLSQIHLQSEELKGGTATVRKPRRGGVPLALAASLGDEQSPVSEIRFN